MPIKYSGDHLNITRTRTGFWSLDFAVRNPESNSMGIPSHAIIELYGPTSVGKSTWAWTIASRLNPQGTIALADFEISDPEYSHLILSNAGFDGTVEVINEETDEGMLDKLAAVMSRDDASVGILDSMGAISPVEEREGKIGDAVMGRRAKMIGPFTRKAIFCMRKHPCNFITITHIHSNLGTPGFSTAGGVTKDYLSAIRIRLSRQETFDDGSYLVQGKVDKNRFGLTGQFFQMFCLVGFGFHPGLSAVFDCILYGLAERPKGGIIKLGEESHGRLSAMFEKAKRGETEPFEPFVKRLEAFEKEE